MYDVFSLVGENNDNSVEEANERERRENRQEAILEELFRCEVNHCISGDDACYEGYPKVLVRILAIASTCLRTTHDKNRNGHAPIRYMNLSTSFFADYVDE